MPDTAQFTQLIMVSAIVMLAVDTILAVDTLAGRLADGAAAGQLDGVARFKKRSITTVIPLLYAPLLYADLYYTRFLSKSLVLPNTSITRQITSILRGPLLYAVFSIKSGTPDHRV